ncbi:MAG: hypothetical protein R3B84_19420 [Zavarzinella sp.]
MTNQEWMDLLRSIPETEHTKLVVVLNTGIEYTMDTLFRLEPNYLVMRGRQAGTTDEARAFFIPYSHMVLLKLEKEITLEELTNMIDNGKPWTNPRISSRRLPRPEVIPAPEPKEAPVVDPATASKMLIDRIRAARATGGHSPAANGPASVTAKD